MNERALRQQLADLTTRLFQVEAELAAMRGLLYPQSGNPPGSNEQPAEPAPATAKAAPKAAPRAPAVPKRPKKEGA